MKLKSFLSIRLLALCCILFETCPLSAYDKRVLINSLYVGLSDKEKTAQILSAQSSISGNVTIYGSIQYDDSTYRVTSIDNKAFSRCTQLSGITISDSIESIGYQVFEWCSNLVRVKLPQAITSIKQSTFLGCSSLKEVNIPDSVKTIEEYTFSGCSSLENIHIPSSVTYIGRNTFMDCTSLTNILIPESVKELGLSVFGGCSNLTIVHLPSDLKVINDMLFMGCSSLKEITIPTSVTSIKGSAFGDCTSLIHITIPQTVTTIGRQAFKGCGNLQSVTLPNSIKLIDDYAFADCVKLKDFSFPDSAKIVHEGTFSNCTSLIHISLPQSLTSIKDRAFSDCSTLAQIDLPDGLRIIEEFAFYGCARLTSITIPRALTIISESTFANCVELKDVELHKDVTTIDEDAFYGCTKLTHVQLSDSLKYLSGFRGCSGLSSITLPVGVKTIGFAAFENCTGITRLNIPSSVVQIEDRAFSGCSNLRSMVLPKSITTIGDYAFSGCTNLDSVVILRPIPKNVGEELFSDSTLENATLYVPVGTSKAYRSSESFQFKNIVEIDMNGSSIEAEVLLSNTIFNRRDNKTFIDIALKSNRPITGLQFNLTLPTGFTVETDKDGEPVADETERSKQHSIRINKISDGYYGFVLFSLENKTFAGDSGIVLRIPLLVDDDLKMGDYAYEVTNIVCSYMKDGKAFGIDVESAKKTLTITPAAGDANVDGKLNVLDVVEVTNYIVGAPSKAFDITAADYNGDGKVDVVDVTDMVNVIVTRAPESKSVRLVKSLDMPINSNEDSIWADGVTDIVPGTLQELNIYLNNAADDLSAYQFDLELPEGIEVATNEEGLYVARLNSARHADSHFLTVGKRQGTNNTYGFLCMSTSNEHLKLHEGLLLTIMLKDTKEDVAEKDSLRAELKDIVFSTANAGKVSQEVEMPNTSFTINEWPVGVHQVRTFNQTARNAVYTLDGLKLPIGVKLKKGIYIKNGKKVLVW